MIINIFNNDNDKCYLSILVKRNIILLLGLANGISKQTLAIFHRSFKKLSKDNDDVGLERGLGDLILLSEVTGELRVPLLDLLPEELLGSSAKTSASKSYKTVFRQTSGQIPKSRNNTHILSDSNNFLWYLTLTGTALVGRSL
jgi:hypothetical protein